MTKSAIGDSDRESHENGYSTRPKKTAEAGHILDVSRKSSVTLRMMPIITVIDIDKKTRPVVAALCVKCYDPMGLVTSQR